MVKTFIIVLVVLALCTACHPVQPAPGVVAEGTYLCEYYGMKYISSDWYSNVQCRDENGTCHDYCASRLKTLKCNQETSCASLGERT